MWLQVVSWSLLSHSFIHSLIPSFQQNKQEHTARHTESKPTQQTQSTQVLLTPPTICPPTPRVQVLTTQSSDWKRTWSPWMTKFHLATMASRHCAAAHPLPIVDEVRPQATHATPFARLSIVAGGYTTLESLSLNRKETRRQGDTCSGRVDYVDNLQNWRSMRVPAVLCLCDGGFWRVRYIVTPRVR